MNRWKRIGVVFFVVFFGLTVGFAISAAQHRFSLARQPVEVQVGGSIGAPVAVSVSGNADFVTDDGLVERTQMVDVVGSGRKVEADGQVLTRVSTFYLREDGLTADTGSRYYTGAAGKDALGSYAQAVIGQAEGSRIVILEPETPRAATISVVDVLPTVLFGRPGDTQPINGLPGVGTDDAGRPVIIAAGGSVTTLREATMIEGAGEQVQAGDTVVVNYLLAAPDGSVIENTWDAPSPVVMPVDDLFTGLQSGLKDARIGSRIVLAIPAAQAQGKADVAIVMDVLAKLPQE